LLIAVNVQVLGYIVGHNLKLRHLRHLCWLQTLCYPHTHSHSHPHTHTLTLTQTHTHTLTHSHTQTQTHTYTLTHTLTHTHTHTHITVPYCIYLHSEMGQAVQLFETSATRRVGPGSIPLDLHMKT
jgi:hypothetical protein